MAREVASCAEAVVVTSESTIRMDIGFERGTVLLPE